MSCISHLEVHHFSIISSCLILRDSHGNLKAVTPNVPPHPPSQQPLTDNSPSLISEGLYPVRNMCLAMCSTVLTTLNSYYGADEA